MLTGFEGPILMMFSAASFSVGSVSENDSPKPCDAEAASHSANTYQLARSVGCKDIR